MKVSIITVTYNAEKFLRSCLNSVQAQTYPDIEHILVDGLSTDNTLSIIASYDNVAQTVSEKDHGMYDALNKGIAMATGEIVGVVHADDFLASTGVLKEVSTLFKLTGADILYGNLDYVDQANPDKVVRRWRSGPYQHGMFQWGWMPPHPTFYVRREMFEKYGNYRLDMGSAADYELMIRFLHKYKLKSAYLPQVMVKMRVGGMSNSSVEARLKANRADLEAMKLNGIRYPRLAAILKPLRKLPQFLPFS